MTYVLSGTLTNQPQPAENLLPENAMIYPTPKAQCNCSKVLNISNEKNISITMYKSFEFAEFVQTGSESCKPLSVDQHSDRDKGYCLLYTSPSPRD